MSEGTIEALLHAVGGELGAAPSLAVEHAEFDYGCGYASFVDVLVTRPDGSERMRSCDGYLTTHGLPLLLCRLTSITALLTDAERERGPAGNGHASVPESTSLASSPDGNRRVCATIAVLDRYGISLVYPDVLQQAALPGLSIETNLSGSGNRFDLFDV